MNEPYRDHPSEEALERFVLRMAPEEELEIIETHIFACEYCVEEIETLETRIAATRLALKELEEQRATKRPIEPSLRWKSWFTIPKLSLASAAATLAAGIVFFSIPLDVSITAFRGTETAIVSAGRPLHLHLNAASLLPGPIAVELANGQGSIVWKGTSIVRHGSVHDSVDVTLPRITQSGPHFLRLYSLPRTGTDSELLREFVLNAQWTL